MSASRSSGRLLPTEGRDTFGADGRLISRMNMMDGDRKWALFGLLALGVAGCANPYRKNFQPTTWNVPDWFTERLGDPAVEPKLLVSDAVASDNRRLFESGYILVGYSKFEGPEVDLEKALDAGRKIGADVVAVDRDYAGTVKKTVPYTYWTGDRTTRIRETGSTPSNRTFRRDVEITTGGDAQTVFVPQETRVYHQAATYWKKLQRVFLGAYLADLTVEQRRAIGTNRGLEVKGLIKGSPAFNADIFPGDIVTHLNGEPVPVAREFYRGLDDRAGETVDLTLLRDGREIHRRVSLNP